MAAEERAEPEVNLEAGIPKPQIDVVARPVDTMVNPAQGTQLGQLARALSPFSKDMGELADNLVARQKASAEREGTIVATNADVKARAAETAGDMQGYASAVNEGLFPHIANPYARIFAREITGTLTGDHYRDWLESQPDVAETMNNSTDPGAFSSLEANKRQEYIASHFGSTHSDPVFRSSFDKMANAAATDLGHKYADEVNKRFVGITGVHLANLMANHITDGLSDGRSQEEIRTDLQGMVTEAVAHNMPESVAREGIARALDNAAKSRGDVTIYDLANGLKLKGSDGKEYDLSGDTTFGDLREKGIQSIIRQEHSALQVASQQRSEKQAQARADVASKLMDDIKKNPTGTLDLTGYYDAYISAGLGTKMGEVDAIVKAVKADQPSNAQTVDHLMGSIALVNDPMESDYVSKATLVHALSNGSINQESFKTLLAERERQDQVRKGRGRANSFEETDATEKRYLGDMEHIFTAEGATALGGANAIAYVRASGELTRDVRQYQKLHEKEGIDMDKFEAFLQSRVDRLVNYYVGEGSVQVMTQAKKQRATSVGSKEVSDFVKAESSTP